jgi:outer membrane protein assembly factor BamB
MDQQTPKFTPKLVDEQLDQLLARRSPTDQNARIVADLNQMYQDDQRSLAKVWQCLGIENEQSDSTAWQPKTLSTAMTTPQPASAQILDLERNRSMRQSRKHSLTRTFSLLAAACVVALLVGSLLFVFNLIHQNQGSHVAASNTPQGNLPQGIYTNTSSHLFRLDPQTHQALWQQAIKDVGQIIPAGNMVYVLQESDSVMALDANSGKVLWKYAFPIAKAEQDASKLQLHVNFQVSNLVLSQGRLYVSWETWADPNQVNTSQKTVQVTNVVKTLYVLNASNGKQQAAYPNTFGSELTVGNGVIAMDNEHGLQAYDSTNGKPLWQLALTGMTPVRNLNIVNNLIYATISDNTQDIAGQGQSYIASYDTSGNQVWRSPTFPGDALGSFTVDQNVIYFGILRPDSAVGQVFTGRVYAYDIQSNKQLWSKAVDGGAQENLFINNGVIYTVADSGSQGHAHLVALDTTTGTLKWQYTLRGGFVNGFVVSDGIIYISSDTTSQNDPLPAEIDALNATNGHLLWQDTQHGDSNFTPTK